MNFEQIQSLWAGQFTAPVPTPELIARQRTLLTEFKRRGRFLGYELFGLAFGLVMTPLISFVNYLHAPQAGTPLYWVSAALHLVVLIAAAAWVIRRLQRHRALGRVCISSLREQAEVSKANLEAELRDIRLVPWLLAMWAGLAILSIAANSPFHGGTWDAVCLRVALVLGFAIVSGWVLRLHYRVNLLPAHARQQEILQQLGP